MQARNVILVCPYITPGAVPFQKVHLCTLSTHKWVQIITINVHVSLKHVHISI